MTANLEKIGENDGNNHNSQPKTETENPSLTDLYEKQDVKYSGVISKKNPPLPIRGAPIFVAGLMLLLVPAALIMPGTGLLAALIAVGMCLILLGVYILRESLFALKLLVAGSLLAMVGFSACLFGISGIIEGMAIIEAAPPPVCKVGLFNEGHKLVIFSLIVLIFAIPVFMASAFAIARRKYKWALLGAVLGFFFIGITMAGTLAGTPIPAIFAVFSVILLIISANEFKD